MPPKTPRGTLQPAAQQRRPSVRDLKWESGPRRKSEEEREADARFIRRVLRTAGVRDAEVHARRLVDIREWDGADDPTPATVAHIGSAADARDQLALLKARLADVQKLSAERAKRGIMDKPRVADLDTLWARRVRQDHPDRFLRLDADVAISRQRLAEAKQRGDTSAIPGLRTAVDITVYQVRRAELALRVGDKWEAMKSCHDLAPQLLAELDEKERRVLPVQAATLRTTIDASDPRHAPPERHARLDSEREPAPAAPGMGM